MKVFTENEGKLPLEKRDISTQGLYSLISKKVKKWKANPPKAEDIKIPSDNLVREKAKVANTFPIPESDEDMGELPFVNKAANKFLSKLAIVDHEEEWENLDEARKLLRHKFDDIMPSKNVVWKDFKSDAAMAQLAFNGLGAHKLRRLSRDKDKASFMVDMSYLSAFPVREGFHKFGATAYFAEDTSIVRIYICDGDYDVYPGQEGWEFAKWVWKSSLFAGVTLTDHLGGNHFVVANLKSIVTMEVLPPDHPIRRFLKPFYYRTNAINFNAYMGLSNKGGIGHRTWSFTYEGIVGCIAQCLNIVKIQTFPQFLKVHGLDTLIEKSAFVQDHLDLWNVMRSYTKAYCEIFYQGEELSKDPDIRKWWIECSNLYPQVHFPPINTAEDIIDLLTIFVYEGSAVHEHIGAVAEYIEDPEFLTTKIRKGKIVNDVQSTYQIHLLMAATGMQQPALMSNFKHLFLNEHRSEAETVFDKFQADLKKLSEEIERRNLSRVHPYQSANPVNLESSVSI
jgi:hypothetical protein